MSSIITHLYLANYIKNEFNFSDKFLTGSVLPDILRISGKPRDLTHYIKEIKEEDKTFKLPDLKKYASKNPDLLKNEIKLGYFAHLIQDRIWFKNFIPIFTDCECNNNDITYRDGSIHSFDKYLKDIYSDYSLLDRNLIKKFNFNDNFKKKIIKNSPNENLIKILNENISLHELVNPDLTLIKEIEMEKYLEIAKRETKYILNSLLK